ncbi:MAG: polyprenyl synthetase family protein [Thermogutta sp.]
MRDSVNHTAMDSSPLQYVYGVIADEMDEVNCLLRGELQNSSQYLDQMLKHGLQLGGKRLRPALLLLSGKICGQLNQAHIKLAAAVELIHTASLIHDDVLDEAQIRRHMATMNARWDNEASVLLGDYLLARAICLASSLDSVYACQVIAQASHEMCEGELRQIATRGRFDATEEEYIGIINEKTASLYRACCRLGAYYADADPQQIGDLDLFGKDLGIAFQIIDDVLDVLGDERKTGKSLGSDLEKQKPTLPVIRLLAVCEENERKELLTLLRNQPEGYRQLIRQKLLEAGAIEYAQDRARDFISAAIGRLCRFVPSPALDAVRQLAMFVISRDR